MHNFLPTKVPHMEGDVFGIIEPQRPLGDLNTLGFGRFGIEGVVDEAID
jgi:hypothetical protein